MHFHFVEDDNGELIDVIDLCSDFCNQAYCQANPGNVYTGWNGCHEIEFDSVCAECGDKIEGVNHA
jgi:hypothetical protein